MPVQEELAQIVREAIASQTPRQLSLAEMATLAAIAAEMAQKQGVAIVFSLVDDAGRQRYFFSMDNALLVSHSLAQKKAWSAVALKMATHELAQQTQPGGALYGLQHEKGICCLGGGLPCWSQGRLLGAIGVSGGSVEQDINIARETLGRFSEVCFQLTPCQ